MTLIVFPDSDPILGQQLWLGRIVGGTVPLEETIALAQVLLVRRGFRGVRCRRFLHLTQGRLVTTDQRQQRDQPT